MSIETAHLEQQLIERYGLLITRKQLAELLHRSEKALDHTLYHPSGCQLATALNSIKIRFGRSIYFPAADVAALLAGGEGELIENRLSLNAREALQRGINQQQRQDPSPRDAPILRDVSARDLRIVMDVALFQLAKKPQPYAERIYRLDGGDFVKLSSGSAGMATAWDYDIVLKATGYLVRLMDQSEPGPLTGGRTIVIPRSELLMGDGQNQYDRLYARLERLRTTTVEIRRKTGKNVVETSVEGLICGFKIIETDARVTVVELSLPMWLHSEVVGGRTPNVLRIDPAYFSIRSSLARYIYRVARFAAQEGARYRFETLYLRSGSTEGKSQFSARLRELIKTDSIPEFHLREIRGESGPLLLINPRR